MTEDTIADTQDASHLKKGSTAGTGQDISAGTCVGRFVILSQLGRGGMGVVYKAYDPQLDRRIAIKLLTVQPKQGETVSKPRDRLVREAQALAKLNHPNVVAVYDVGVFGTGVYVAMEYVEGKTLRNWLGESKRTFDEILRVFVAAGQGLQAAHDQGIIHRDFKPENVMVGEKNRVRILDFGLAKAATRELARNPSDKNPSLETPVAQKLINAKLTQASGYVGTAVYMAPEQVFNTEVTERSDQFSFCVALYESLYGKRPFAGKTINELVWDIVENEIVIPKSDVPKYIGPILTRGLSEDHQKRYASMDDLLCDLIRDPQVEKRAQRKKQIWAVLIVIIAVIPFGLWQILFQDGDLCSGAEKKVSGIWNTQKQKTIKQAFARTGLSYASDAMMRVESRLGAYLQQWKTAYTEACEETRIRGEQSEEILDRKMGCLHKHLANAKALIQVFEQADKTVVGKAVQAIFSLSEVAHCHDIEALLSPIPVPKDKRTKIEVGRIRKELFSIEALRITGKYRAGLEKLKALKEKAGEVNYRPIQAELLYKEGELRERVGEYTHAEAALHHAAREAGACKDALLTSKAFILLVAIVGYKQARPEVGLAIAQNAQALMGLSGSDDALKSRFYNNLGGVYWTTGNFDKALDNFGKALALREKALGPKHPEVASLLNNMGVVSSNVGEFQKAIQYYQKAIAIRQATLGPSHPDLALALNNIGNALSAQGNYNQSHQFHQRALEIWKNALGPKHPQVAYAQMGLGEALQAQQKFDKAHAHFQQARAIWESALGPDHPQVVWPLSSIGTGLIDQGKPNQALAYLKRAKGICQKTPCEQTPHAQTLYSLARATMATKGDRTSAYQHAQQAIRIYEKTPNSFKRELAEVRAWLEKRKR